MDNIYFEIFGKRLCKFAKAEIRETDQGIEVLDEGGHVVAMLTYSIDNANKKLYDIALNSDMNNNDASVAAKLLKHFQKLYKEKYWGYKINGGFANANLCKLFNKAVEKGYFPEDCVEIDMNHPDNPDQDKQEMEEYKNESQQWYDSERKKKDMLKDMDISDLPKPYKGEIGDGAIYKNINKEQADKINDIINKINGDGYINQICMNADDNNLYFNEDWMNYDILYDAGTIYVLTDAGATITDDFSSKIKDAGWSVNSVSEQCKNKYKSAKSKSRLRKLV